MSSYTTISGNPTIPSFNQFAAFTLTAEPTLLSWPNNFQNGPNVVASIMELTTTANEQILILPNAMTTSPGTSFIINNLDDHTTIIQANDSTQINQFEHQGMLFYYLEDNSTQAGTWRVGTAFGGGTAITSVGADVPDATDAENLIITSTTTNPITSSGVFNFAFAGDLLALISFDTASGFSVRTAADTWALRTITGQAGAIQVTNGNGVLGNPVLTLASNLTNLNSITVGNLILSGTTVATNNNTTLNLGAAGFPVLSLGELQVSHGYNLKFISNNAGHTLSLGVNDATLGATYSLIFPDAAPAINQVLKNTSATTPFQLQWAAIPTVSGAATVNAIPYFTNTGGEISSSSVIYTPGAPGALTGIGALTVDNIQLGIANNNTISALVGGLSIATEGNNILTLDAGAGNVSSLCTAFLLDSDNAILSFKTAGGITSLSAPTASVNNITLNLPATVGNNGDVIITDGANPANLSFVTPVAIFNNTSIIAKGWATFNGVGSISGLNNQGRITNVTRLGVGQYLFTFSAGTFTNTNYGMTYSLQSPSDTGSGPGTNVSYAVFNAGRTTTSCQINCFDSTDTATDWTYVTMVFWGI